MIQIVTTYHFLFSFTIFFFQHENLKNNKNPKISKRSPKIPIPNEGIKRKFHSFFSTSHCETERDRETYYRLPKDRKLEREEEDQTGGEKGKERRGEERRNGHVRECLAVRSGRNSGGRDGIAGGVSGKASLRAGATWSHEVLPDHAVSPPPHLRGRLSPRLRWRPPPLLVHQALPRLSRSPFSLSLSLIRLLLVFVSESQGLVVVVAIYHIYIHIGVASLRFEFSSSNWSIRLLFFYFGIFMFGGILNFVQVSFSKSQVAVSLNQGFVVVRLQEFSVQSR